MSWLHAVIDVPADKHAAAGDFWTAVLGWPLGAPWPGHPELASFEPPGGGRYVHLQQIQGPPRVHVDLESADPARTIGAARDLGATLVAEHDRWTTVRSPGGLPFCVVRADSHDGPPPPATWPDGHRSRMVQVCIDSPRAAHDREVAFWHGLLGERWSETGGSEFAAKWHDDAGSPLQLLFQRLDEPDGPVRAHLDHGTDDVAAETARLLGLGATDLGAGDDWHVLRDPAGQVFCVTPNSPDSPLRRHLS
jgi:hypothetical protein